jgi:hypothetical protein
MQGGEPCGREPRLLRGPPFCHLHWPPVPVTAASCKGLWLSAAAGSPSRQCFGIVTKWSRTRPNGELGPQKAGRMGPARPPGAPGCATSLGGHRARKNASGGEWKLKGHQGTNTIQDPGWFSPTAAEPAPTQRPTQMAQGARGQVFGILWNGAASKRDSTCCMTRPKGVAGPG